MRGFFERMKYYRSTFNIEKMFRIMFFLKKVTFKEIFLYDIRYRNAFQLLKKKNYKIILVLIRFSKLFLPQFC